MKRHLCVVLGGLVLALAGTGTASGGILPSLGIDQQATQTSTFGDQSVGEQKNEGSVSQEQGNGNVNVSPAIAIGGDASTWNAQGNGNEANADVDQSNRATQKQESSQGEALSQGGSGKGCCGSGQSQTGTQDSTFGDQSVGEQKNEGSVSQEQGNGNVNVSPAIAIGGDASTWNAQGNGNEANADVDQSNRATQKQESSQGEALSQGGSGKGCCGSGQSQTGTQDSTFGDQSVGEQKNEGSVSQEQGNGNVNVSPAIAIGGKQQGGCHSKCGSHRSHGSDASTWNAQGNGNEANADVDQSNVVAQTQSSSQKQFLWQGGGGWGKQPTNGCGHQSDCSKPSHPSKNDRTCCGGGDQSGTQQASFGDQSAGTQQNTASVTQKQGNENLNVSPAGSFGGSGHGCDKGVNRSSCGSNPWSGGDAATGNAQGNGNDADASVQQHNAVRQSQSSQQWQRFAQECCEGIAQDCREEVSR